MRPLVGLIPETDPELGNESMTSYLRRLGAVYFLSLNQILRYLTESKEVNDLAGTKPFRMAIQDPTTISGYAGNARRLNRLVAAATGVRNIAATTLQRIGPSLTPRSTNSIATKRRYCPRCLLQMKNCNEMSVWEPLVWSVATVTACPFHGAPLVDAKNQWTALVEEKTKLAATFRPTGTMWRDEWYMIETMKLVRFCSESPEQLTVDNAPTIFIRGILDQRGLTTGELAKRIGAGQGNLDRKLNEGGGTTLHSVFVLAERFAISPITILEDPREAIRQASLFDPLDDPKLEVHHATRTCRTRGDGLLLSIQSDLRDLLASRSPVPSLNSLCKGWGVSTGYVRYRLPNETCRIVARRAKEQASRRVHRTERAYRLARDALTDLDAPDLPASLKRVTKLLQSRSGLPKHLLARALNDFRTRMNTQRFCRS